MEKKSDLRAILSRNIKAARAGLYITQEKLAEYAGISVPHMRDIETCRTWVSDKTLSGIAGALNVDVYELLVPSEQPPGKPPEQPSDNPSEKAPGAGHETADLLAIAALVNETTKTLKKQTAEVMQDLIAQITGLSGQR